ncbi:MAG: transporter substrate-binding domain-containing protein [Lachnospiraceae bacterium]|nr:transporter substrate-binding domain-containing protein [Lachnospiraceae bacterium]
MRRISRIVIISLASLLLVPFKVNAEEPRQKTVNIGYFENEIFQEGAKEGVVKDGYAYEYYRKLSEYTGWEYTYTYGDFADLYNMLLEGKIDMLAGLAKTKEREAVINYPDTAMGSETYNMVKHADDDSITYSYDTLTGKKIGVLDSAMVGVLERFLTEHEISADVNKYPDYQSMLDDFDKGDIDAFVAESDGASDRKNAELLYAFGSSDYYLCVTLDRKDLLDELNMAQEQLSVEEPNYINSLRIRYYSSSL